MKSSLKSNKCRKWLIEHLGLPYKSTVVHLTYSVKNVYTSVHEDSGYNLFKIAHSCTRFDRKVSILIIVILSNKLSSSTRQKSFNLNTSTRIFTDSEKHLFMYILSNLLYASCNRNSHDFK